MTPTIGQTPWERFQDARQKRGVPMEQIERATAMHRSAIRQMLLGYYGHPATPEKRERLLRALNEGPGAAVQESDIWVAPEPQTSESA